MPMKFHLVMLLALMTPACTTTEVEKVDSRYRTVKCLCAAGHVFSNYTYRCVLLGSSDAIESNEPARVPVCGCDGKTYVSVEEAGRHGVTYTRPGNCDGKMTYQRLWDYSQASGPPERHCENPLEVSSFDRSKLCSARGVKEHDPCSKLHDLCYTTVPLQCYEGNTAWDLPPQRLHCAFRKANK